MSRREQGNQFCSWFVMEDIRAAYRNLRRAGGTSDSKFEGWFSVGSLVELHTRDRIRSRRSLFIILTPYVVPRGDASTDPLRRLTRVYYNVRRISDSCPLREQDYSTHPIF
jgi:hypothetical protein